MTLMVSASKNTWHVAFLVRDFPVELRTLGPAHFSGNIDEAFLDALRKIGKPWILTFIDHRPASRFVWVGFHIEAGSRLDAIAEARHRMEGFIDGASFWGDNEWPVISEFVWLGQPNDPDLYIVQHHRQVWFELVTSPQDSRTEWKHRDDELRVRIIRFFGLALDQHSRSMTSLGRQIRHSMRMFRHGKHSGSWGVEFICKFCALEGLVCGDERYDKEKKLKKRLAALFRDRSNKFADRIAKLWRYRSEAVHSAKAFDAGGLDDGAPLGVHIEDIEHLFAGALVFALEHIDTVDEIATLWPVVERFTLPDFARLSRPRDFPKYAVTDMEMNTGVRMPGGGELLKHHLSAARARFESANPMPPVSIPSAPDSL